MNFLIIGHSVVDKIFRKEKIFVKPGGIFYSVISFLSLVHPEDKLYLCTSFDRENFYLFRDVYEKVEPDFLISADYISKVELIVDLIGERKERYSAVSESLTLPTDNLNRFDGIMVNMISGYDISIYQLKQLRENYKGIIYFDVHTLSRGVDQNLNRIFKPIRNFKIWAKCIDILQANESELLTLSEETDETKIVEELFSYGVNQIIVTKAERGATVYNKENDFARKIHSDALHFQGNNNVGCGDVFGAAYFYNYIKNKNVTLALEKANLFAGLATTYSEIKEFQNLKRDASERIGKK
jgi:hypothetical protein